MQKQIHYRHTESKYLNIKLPNIHEVQKLNNQNILQKKPYITDKTQIMYSTFNFSSVELFA